MESKDKKEELVCMKSTLEVLKVQLRQSAKVLGAMDKVLLMQRGTTQSNPPSSREEDLTSLCI